MTVTHCPCSALRVSTQRWGSKAELICLDVVEVLHMPKCFVCTKAKCTHRCEPSEHQMTCCGWAVWPALELRYASSTGEHSFNHNFTSGTWSAACVWPCGEEFAHLFSSIPFRICDSSANKILPWNEWTWSFWWHLVMAVILYSPYDKWCRSAEVFSVCPSVIS